MIPTSLARTIVATCLGLAGASLPMRAAEAQIPVIDATNLTQNILQAVRALQQVNNQIKSLQNEAVMLEDMAKHLQTLNFSSLDGMITTLSQISGLMDRAQGIAFDVNATETAFAETYPQSRATLPASRPPTASSLLR